MKFITVTPTLIVILLLSACQTPKTNSSTISLHPSDLEIFSGPLEELLEIEKIVPLETKPEALIGGIWGFAQSKSGILIRNKGNQSLFIYNEDGSLRTKIACQGKGPGEYVEVFGQDWIPSSDNTEQEIVLSDVYGKKLLFFSGDGKFISETKVPFRIHQIAAVSSDYILCHKGRFNIMGQNGQGGNELFVLDRKGTEIKRFFPYPEPVQFEMGTGFSQGISGDGKSYYKQLDPTIYQVNTELNLDTIWNFDFGNFNPDTSRLLISGREGIQNLEKMSKTDPFLSLTSMVQSTNSLLVTFYHKKTAHNNFISNKSKSIQTLAADSLNRIGYWRGLPVYSPDWSYGKSFIYDLSAFGWMELLEEIDDETRTYMRKKIPGFIDAESFTENDNPVLVYFKLKDF